MKIISKIDFPHLILTVFVTFICVIPTFIILLIAENQILEGLYTNDWSHALRVIILMTMVFIIALTILIKKNFKVKLTNQKKSLSFKITSILLTIFFCWFARLPLIGLLTNNPSGKSSMDRINEDNLKIEKFVNENTKDSITTKQIDMLIDTLGAGWKRVDTIKKN